MKLKNRFEITGIGSMPYESEGAACDIILPSFRKIPFWPQLVKKSFLEDMMVQFTERMPGIEVDIKEKRVFINRKRNIKKEINELNERYFSEDLEYFSISEDYAAGLYEYMYRLKNLDNTMIDYLKGQITGPISLTFTISDEDGIPLFFDKDLREAAVKTLSLRARWQAARLKQIFKDVIIFIDEPSLLFFKQSPTGSKIKKEELVEYINRVVGAIHTEACYAGVHCCGDADWDFLLSSDIDILSIDAYNYGESFVKSYEKILKFLERGGIIAWGVIPTALDALKVDVASLVAKLENYVEILSRKNIDKKKIIKSLLITPSCGCGALSKQEAEVVAEHCVKFSQLAKEKILV
jgi:methionine synthase II (cobalamin-independent)